MPFSLSKLMIPMLIVSALSILWLVSGWGFLAFIMSLGLFFNGYFIGIDAERTRKHPAKVPPV